VTCPRPAGVRASCAGRSDRLILAFRFALCFAALSGGAFAQAPAETAAPAAPQVRVDCPELSEEQRAAIEAREMSELLSQGVQSGTLLLICSSDRVSGIWQENDVTVESRFLSRNAGESAIEPLHWLASVLLELRSQREASPPLVPAAAATAAAPPAPATTAETSPPATAEGESASSAGSSESSPVTTAPEASPPADGSESAPPGRWTIALGAIYSHFGTEIPGALGPRAGGGYRILPRLHATLWADARWSARMNEGFGTFEVSTALGVTYDILPFLSVMAGPRLVLTTFSLPEGTTGSRAPVVAGGFLAAARAKIPLYPARPFLDLGVEAATPARQATLAGDPMLTIPAWQTMLAAGIELEL
jgi:hypothetical protein